MSKQMIFVFTAVLLLTKALFCEIESAKIADYNFNGNAINTKTGLNGQEYGTWRYGFGLKGTGIYLDNTTSTPAKQSYAALHDFDPNSSGTADEMSVSIWVKTLTTSGDHCYVGKNTSTGGNILLLGRWNSGKLRVQLRSVYYDITDTEKANEWTHYVFTGKKVSGQTQTEVKVYKNGSLLGTTTMNDVLGNMTGRSWVVGQEWDTNTLSDFTNGEFDELAFFNRVLTAEEISALFKEQNDQNVYQGRYVSYSFDNNTNISTYGNSITNTGTTAGTIAYQAGHLGSSIQLSNSGYVNLAEFNPNSAGTADEFSVELRVKPTSATGNHAYVAKNSSDGATNFFLFGYWSGQPKVEIRGQSYGVTSAEPIGVWTHWVVVAKKVPSVSQTEVTVYKNGFKLYTTTLNAVIGTITGKPWAIGQEWDSGPVPSDYTIGEFDEVVFYSRALTAAEVAKRAQYPQLNDNLLAHYTFDGNFDSRAKQFGYYPAQATSAITLTTNSDGSAAEFSEVVNNVPGIISAGMNDHTIGSSELHDPRLFYSGTENRGWAVSFWVRPDSGNYSETYYSRNYADGNNGYRMIQGTDQVLKADKDGATPTSISLTGLGAGETENAWSHYVINYLISGSTTIVRVYKNGVFYENGTNGNSGTFGSAYSSITDATTHKPWTFGGEYDYNDPVPNDLFDGLMDNIRFYGRTLNEVEVNTLYNMCEMEHMHRDSSGGCDCDYGYEPDPNNPGCIIDEGAGGVIGGDDVKAYYRFNDEDYVVFNSSNQLYYFNQIIPETVEQITTDDECTLLQNSLEIFSYYNVAQVTATPNLVQNTSCPYTGQECFSFSTDQYLSIARASKRKQCAAPLCINCTFDSHQIYSADIPSANNFSIGFWAKPASPDYFISMYKQEVASGVTTYIDLGVSIGSNPKATLTISNSTQTVSSSFLLEYVTSPRNQNSGWNYYFIVFRNSGAYLYINGFKQNNSPVRLTENIQFEDGNTNNFLMYINGGSLDELVLYNRDLSDSEIKDHYFGFVCAAGEKQSGADCVEACGDGILDFGEECDDGNSVNTDACTNTCEIAVCGDSITRTGVEECDDGNFNNNDNCLNDCTNYDCGDGYLNTGVETCETTDSISCTEALGVTSTGTAPCNSSCNGWNTAGNCTKTFPCNSKPDIPTNSTIWNTVSSYNQTWTGSAWSPVDDADTNYDASGSSTSCRYTCNSTNQYVYDASLPVSNKCRKCGDGIKAGIEVCDGTDLNNKTCLTEVSGSTGGTLSCNAACNSFVTTGCTKSYTCTGLPTGSVWYNNTTTYTYNQAWTGSAWNPADSSATYSQTPAVNTCQYKCASGYVRIGNVCTQCGNGTTDAGETCDDGVANNGTYGYCKTDCSGIGEHCGDEIVNGPEICDLGSSNGSTGSCSATCTCNDGYEPGSGGCVDINECAIPVGEAVNICATKHHFICNNTTGSFSCGCASGFVRLYDNNSDNADDVYGYVPNEPLYREDDLFDLNALGIMDPTRGTSISKLLFCDSTSLYEDILDSYPGTEDDAAAIDGYVNDFCGRLYFNSTAEEKTVAVRFLMKFLNTAISNLILDNGAAEGAAVRNRQLIDTYINTNASQLLVTVREFDDTWGGTVNEGLCVDRISLPCAEVQDDLEEIFAEEKSSVKVVVYPASATAFNAPAECESGCMVDYIHESGRACMDRDIVFFDDSRFYSCILDEVGNLDMAGADDEYVTADEVAALTAIDCSNPSSGNEIKSIRGIEYAVNAKDIYLGGNRITDLYPLQELGELKKVGASTRINVCNDDDFKVKIYDLSKNATGFVPEHSNFVKIVPRAFYRNEVKGVKELLFNRDGVKGFCTTDENCSDGYYCDTDKNLCIESCSADSDCGNEYVYCNTSTNKCIAECSESDPCREGYECDLSESRCVIKDEYRILSESAPHYFNCPGYATYVEIEDSNPNTPQFAIYCHRNMEGSYVVPEIKIKPVTSVTELAGVAPDSNGCVSGTAFDIYTTDYENNSRVNENAEMMEIEDEIRGELTLKASAKAKIIPDRYLVVRYIAGCTGLTGCPTSNPELCDDCSDMLEEYNLQESLAESVCGPDRSALQITYTGLDINQALDGEEEDEDGLKYRTFCIDESTGEFPAVEISETDGAGGHKVNVIPRYINYGSLELLDISGNSRNTPVTENGTTRCPSITEFSPLSYLTSLEYLNISNNWYNSYNGSVCVFQPRSGFPFLSPLQNLFWLDISGTGIGNDPSEDNDDAVTGNIFDPDDYMIYRRTGTRAIGDLNRLKTLKMANNGMDYINPRLSTRFESCECEKLSFMNEYKYLSEDPRMDYCKINHIDSRPEDAPAVSTVQNYFEISIPEDFSVWNGTGDPSSSVRIENFSINVDGNGSELYIEKYYPTAKVITPSVLMNDIINHYSEYGTVVYKGGDLANVFRQLTPGSSEDLAAKTTLSFYRKLVIDSNNKKVYVRLSGKNSIQIWGRYYRPSTIVNYGKTIVMASVFTQFGTESSCDTFPFASEDINGDSTIDSNDLQDRCNCDPFKGVCYGTKIVNPSLFEKLGNLQYLDISDNPLDEQTVLELKNGSLQETEIGKLDGVDRLAGLRGLYAGSNGLTVDDMVHLKPLTDMMILDLSGNSIIYVSSVKITGPTYSYTYDSPFEGFTKLRELVMADNGIGTGETLKVLENAKELRYLDISGNDLTDGGFISRLNRLEYLDASDNDIVISNLNEMPFKGTLPYLRYLDLSGNGTVTQVFWLSKAPLLEEVNLSDNTVKNVYVMANLKNLKKVDISNNCISDTSPVDFVAEKLTTPQNSGCFAAYNEAICGDGIIQRADCTGYDNCIQVSGASEECDGNSIACSEIDAEFVYGMAWCNRDCSDFDDTTCYLNDDDSIPDTDISDDENCANGEVVNSVCICDYGYTLSDGTCIKDAPFVEKGESARTIAESSGATSGMNTGWGEPADADADTNDDDTASPEEVEYIHGCPVPTVENCFSEKYNRDKCGILHRETCFDIQKFCAFRGNQCCIPESVESDSNCNPKYNGYCEVVNGTCTRKASNPDGEPFYGCHMEGTQCVSLSPDCSEEVGDPCERDSDCGCDDSSGQCESKCVKRKVLNTIPDPDVYENMKVCVSIKCHGSVTVDSFCDEWDIKNNGRIVCVPKPVKDYFVFPYEDFEDLKDIGYDNGFYDETRLPEPAFIGRSSFSSYLTWAQQRQASIHNIVRPVEQKFAHLIDPGKDPEIFGTACEWGSPCVDGDSGRSAGYGNAFSRDRDDRDGGNPDDASTLSEDEMFRVGCLVYGCEGDISSKYSPSNYYSVMQTLYPTLTIPNYLFAPVSGCSPSSTMSSAEIRNCVAAEGAVIGRFGRDSMTFNSKIDSCEEFVYQKFYDYNRFVDIASVYEREPFRIIAETFDLPSFSGGCTQSDFDRMGGMNWPSVFSLCESGKLYSANVFWEAVNGIASNNGPFNSVNPHISNGLAFNGTYGISFSTGIINDSASKLCDWPDDSGAINTMFSCSSGVTKNFASYQGAVNGLSLAQIAQLDRGYLFVRTLKEQLMYLLLSRANIETLWNEKREEALKIHPEDEDYYKVPEITAKTRDILRRFEAYNDVRWIDTIDDVTSPDLVSKYENDEMDAADAIDQARIRKFEELHQKLDFDIRTTKFDLTENAKKLWSDDHYDNNRYLMNEFTNDVRDSRISFYPGDDTVYLIENTLAEIDSRIGEVLSLVDSISLSYGTETIALDCFGSHNSPNAACNLDPADFVREMSSLVSPKVLEANYKKCETVTNNSDEMFKDVGDKDAILSNHKPLLVPSLSWLSALGNLNCDIDADPNGNFCADSMAYLETLIKGYKKGDTEIVSQEHLSFGGNLFDIMYFKPTIAQVEDNDLSITDAKWRFMYEDSERQEVCDNIDGLLPCDFTYDIDENTHDTYESCYGLSTTATSVDLLNPDIDEYEKWQCLEAYFDAMPLLQSELIAVKQRVSAIEKGYEIKKAQIAAKKLKTAGMFDPKGAGQNEMQKQTKDDADDDSGSKNPLNIPTSMEKWFSDYRQFGVDDLNAYYNFITGFGVKDFILDYNKFNPLPYLKDVDAFMPHIARAIYKNNFPGVYESKMNGTPQDRAELELDIQKISIWMKNNLDNIKTIEDGFRQAVSMMKGFSMNKFSQMAKGAIPVFDTEKILDAVAKEAARELMLNIARSNSAQDADPGKMEETFKLLTDAKNLALNDIPDSPDDLEDYKEKQRLIEDLIGKYEKDMQFNVGVIRSMVNEKKETIETIKGFIEGTISGDNPLEAAYTAFSDADIKKGIIYVSLVDGSADLDNVKTYLDNINKLPEVCEDTSTYDSKETCRSAMAVTVRNMTGTEKTAMIDSFYSDSNTDITVFLKYYVSNYQTILKNAAHQSIYDFISANLNVTEDNLALIYAVDQKIRNTKMDYSINNRVVKDISFRRAIEVALETCHPYANTPSICEDVSNTISAYMDEAYGSQSEIAANTNIKNVLNYIYVAKQKYINGIKRMVELTNSGNYSNLNKYFQILNNQSLAPKLGFSSFGGELFETGIQKRVDKYLLAAGASIVDLLLDQTPANSEGMSTVINEISKFGSDPFKENSITVPAIELPDFSSTLNALNKNASSIQSLMWSSGFSSYNITEAEYNDIKNKTAAALGNFDDINSLLTSSSTFSSNLSDSVEALSEADVTISSINSEDVRYPVFQFTNLRAGFQESLDVVLLIGESFKNKITDISDLLDFSAIEELRIPVVEGTAVLNLQNALTSDNSNSAFNALKSLKSKLTTVDPILEYNVDLSAIQLSDDFLVRVIKRLFQDSMRFDKLKQLFSAASSGNAVEILTAMSGAPSTDFGELHIKDNGNNDINSFEIFLRGAANQTPQLLDIMADALILRAEEIVTRELFKAPYAEAAAHASSGLTLFGLDVKMFEATFYITTRLQRDEFGRIVDMERVNSKAREKFVDWYDDEIVKFEPYQRFFFVGAVTSLDDLKDAAIAVAQNVAEEGIEEAQKYIDEQLAKLNDVESEEDFGKQTQDSNLKDYKLADLEDGGTIPFQIGPVPAFIDFGYTLECGIRAGFEMNYGWTQGFTIGASAGPYLVVGAYMDAGVGIDYTWVAIKIGIGGQINVFDFYAPFKAQAMLKPEIGLEGIQVNFYLRTSLSPVLSILSGKIRLKVVARVGKCPLCLGFDFRKTIFEFDPLIKLEFGNIIPLKPLKFNLLTIGEGVKLLGHDL